MTPQCTGIMGWEDPAAQMDDAGVTKWEQTQEDEWKVCLWSSMLSDILHATSITSYPTPTLENKINLQEIGLTEETTPNQCGMQTLVRVEGKNEVLQ